MLAVDEVLLDELALHLMRDRCAAGAFPPEWERAAKQGEPLVASKIERILILCKTYPSPSAGHAETSRVAGITESGGLTAS